MLGILQGIWKTIIPFNSGNQQEYKLLQGCQGFQRRFARFPRMRLWKRQRFSHARHPLVVDRAERVGLYQRSCKGPCYIEVSWDFRSMSRGNDLELVNLERLQAFTAPANTVHSVLGPIYLDLRQKSRE